MTTEGSDSTPSGDEDRDRCTYCDQAIDTSDWHPVTTREEEESITVYTFCSESCREAWTETN